MSSSSEEVPEWEPKSKQSDAEEKAEADEQEIQENREWELTRTIMNDLDNIKFKQLNDN